MRIEDKLKLYPHINEEISNLNKQLLNILEEKYNVSVTSRITDMPHGEGISDPTYCHVEKIFVDTDKKIKKITDRIHELNDIHSEVSDLIFKLDYSEKQLIELKLFKNMKWHDVSRKVKYSERQCYRIYNTAMKKIFNEARCQ